MDAMIPAKIRKNFPHPFFNKNNAADTINRSDSTIPLRDPVNIVVAIDTPASAM